MKLVTESPNYHEERRNGATVLICDECGGQRHSGDWPYCKGNPSGHVKDGEFGYDPMEPYVDADLLDRKDPRCTHYNEAGRKGILIETRGQRRKLMKELGLQFGSNHPGGREI